MPSKIRVAEPLGERYHSRMHTLIALVALAVAHPLQDTTLSVIPRPVHMIRGTGEFALTSGTVIVTDRATRQIGYQLADWLQPATGYRVSVAGAASTASRVISLRLDPTLSRLGDEGYRLSVTPSRITIRAFRPAGARSEEHTSELQSRLHL